MGKVLRYAGCALLACCMATVGHAELLTFELGTPYGGVVPGGGNGPWLTAIFEDVSSQYPLPNYNSVQLIMRVNEINQNAYVSSWYFNTDYVLGALTSDYLSGAMAISGYDPKNEKADAGTALNFNLKFDFSDNVLRSGSSIYILSGPGLLASNFNLKNDGGNGEYYSAALLTRNNPELESWIGADGKTPPPTNPVPEPATMLLVGLGLTGLALTGRRVR